MRRTGGQYFAVRSTPFGYAATVRGYGCGHSSAVTAEAVCGAFARGLSDTGHTPAATWSISALMAIIAAQKRSSSVRSSLSVGSTMSVPATGNDIVGAWKP